jgi:hypothetical protein
MCSTDAVKLGADAPLMTDHAYPTDIEGWVHRRLRLDGDVGTGGEYGEILFKREYLSSYRPLEPTHPHCPNCCMPLEHPKLDLPMHQHRGIAFTVTCACGTTATGVFYR